MISSPLWLMLNSHQSRVKWPYCLKELVKKIKIKRLFPVDSVNLDFFFVYIYIFAMITLFMCIYRVSLFLLPPPKKTDICLIHDFRNLGHHRWVSKKLFFIFRKGPSLSNCVKHVGRRVGHHREQHYSDGCLTHVVERHHRESHLWSFH